MKPKKERENFGAWATALGTWRRGEADRSTEGAVWTMRFTRGSGRTREARRKLRWPEVSTGERENQWTAIERKPVWV